MNKRLSALLVGVVLSTSANAFDIYALGTSATNCRGIPSSQNIPAQLERLLKENGSDIRVINGGIDGDKPTWMINRVETVFQNPEVKLVIFEPGPNEKPVRYNIENSETILAKLQAKKIPTIYISNGDIQTTEEGEATAKKYGAYYYGGLGKNLPIDSEHRQFDVPGNRWGGHMTAVGCRKVAEQLYPLVKQVILEQKIQ